MNEYGFDFDFEIRLGAGAVVCGEETAVLKTTHIDFRYGYVDGAGQLCRDCYLKEDRNLITINSRTILDTPNDAELGKKVREIYWESKK